MPPAFISARSAGMLKARIAGSRPSLDNAPPRHQKARRGTHGAGRASARRGGSGKWLVLPPFIPIPGTDGRPAIPSMRCCPSRIHCWPKKCALTCHAVGLDPYVGFMHQPRHGQPRSLWTSWRNSARSSPTARCSLSSTNAVVAERDFVLGRESAALTPGGRKAVFTAWERRLGDGVTHPLFGYKVSYRRAIELQVRLLAKHLTGEVQSYVLS